MLNSQRMFFLEIHFSLFCKIFDTRLWFCSKAVGRLLDNKPNTYQYSAEHYLTGKDKLAYNVVVCQ